MSITLNLGKLAKTMNVHDKLRLLLADAEKQGETMGKENILTPQERDAMLADARRNNEMHIIRKAFTYYRMAQFILIDLDTTFIRYLVYYSSVEKLVLGCHIQAEAHEIIGNILYDQTKQETTDRDKILDALHAKYIPKNSLLQSFDYFIQVDEKGLQEPNTYTQTGFTNMFRSARNVQKKLYKLSYVIEQIGFNFLSDKTKETIEGYRKQIEEFSNLDVLLRPLRMFRDFDFNFVPETQMKEPEFIDTLKNLKTKLEITNEEKEVCRNTIDKYAQEDL